MNPDLKEQFTPNVSGQKLQTRLSPEVPGLWLLSISEDMAFSFATLETAETSCEMFSQEHVKGQAA